MSKKLHNSPDVKGFSNEFMIDEIKILQHADDTSLFLKDIKSLENAIKIIEHFGQVSGMKLNKNKSEGILLGPLKDRYDKLYDINITNAPAKCLGIYIGHDANQCYNKNWTEKIDKLEKKLIIWNTRKLTLYGKCTVINTLALTQLYYTAAILQYPKKETVKKLKKTIFNFLWGKRERIKRNTLIGKQKEGGIGIVDIDCKLKALKGAWVTRIFNNKQSSLKSFFNSCVLRKFITPEYLIKTNIKNADEVKQIFKSLPLFYCEVFSALNECKHKTLVTDFKILSQPIWLNDLIRFNGKLLFYTNWIKSGILYIKDLFDNNGNFHDINYFSNILVNKSNWLCEYNTLKKVIKPIKECQDTTKAAFINIDKQTTIHLKNQTKISLNMISSKILYDILINKTFIKPYSERFWSKSFNLNFEEYKTNIYQSKIIKIRDKQLAEFNYKLLQNLLNNNKSVHKWNKNVSNHCPSCQTIEDTKHLIFDCKNVQLIWKSLEIYLKFKIKWKNVILGFFHEENKTTISLNYLLSYTAFYIYKIKMKLRFENKEENTNDILHFVKSNLMYQYETYKRLNYDFSYKWFYDISINM